MPAKRPEKVAGKRQRNGAKRSRLVPGSRAQRTAVEFCLFHYPTLYTGGIPRRLPAPNDLVWLVPIILEDPDAGISAEVGEVRIDARTGDVTASTPVREVVAAGRELYQGKRDACASAASTGKN